MSSPLIPASGGDEQALPLHLNLLGAPCLVVGERRIKLSPKDAALLCLVALASPIRADRVAALLWPAASAQQADASLRQRLYRLRQATGTALLSSGALLQLAPGLQTDFAPSLRRIPNDPQAAAEELLGDLAFDALPDLAEWLRGERERWREQRDAALATAAAQAENQGAIVLALAYAQRLAQAHPLAEHAQRRLLRLHYLRGDRASAIAAFERFEQRLKDELGTPPAAETRELMATIERDASHLPVRRAVVPASLMRPPRLVGRTAELQALQQAWAASRVFLLLGEAGLGKSRLLQEFAAHQAGVVGVAARPGDAGVAYALLSRLLRAVLAERALQQVQAMQAVQAVQVAQALQSRQSRQSLQGIQEVQGDQGGLAALLPPERAAQLALVLPELGPAVAVAGEAQRRLLQRAVEATLLDALHAGLTALLIDDLHFADNASLECLQALSLAPALSAMGWGLAQRPADAGAALLAWRTALDEGQRLQAVRLQPLNLAQMCELVADLGLPELDPEHLAPALLQHSGGNPMFALETLKDLVLSNDGHSPGPLVPLPQPATVAGLVERRLAQLSPLALKLARVAALAGADFGVELAAAVLELHPLDITEPWSELEAAQVMRGSAFAHDLVFEAARQSVPGPIARWLHRCIAQHLQAQGAAAARVAPHWEAAQVWVAAGEAFVAAARQAQGASQPSHEVASW